MRMLLVLLVALTVVVSANAVPILYNGSFESPVSPLPGGDPAFVAEPTLAQQGGAGWDFGNGAYHSGVTQNLSAFTQTLQAPDGVQAGLVWCVGDEIAQTIGGFEVGKTYTVSWYEAARPGSNNVNLWVLMDAGTLMASHLLPNNLVSTNPNMWNNWKQQSVQFTATATSHRLRFYNSGGWDQMALVDNVQIVPEPATVALLGLGGLLLRRKKA